MRISRAFLAAAVVAFMWAVVPSAEAERYQLFAKLGGEGQSRYPSSLFKNPDGVATDTAGNVYVADSGHQQIQRFSSSGAFLAKWGNDRFFDPTSVATDASGSVYVADHIGRIQRFTSTGTFLGMWGSHGSRDGQFGWSGNYCCSDSGIYVATDAAGNVYVADRYNRRVQKFTATGAFLAKWGSYGSGDGQFNDPDGIATDAGGSVYVSDNPTGQIQKFSSSGAFLGKWGSSTGAGYPQHGRGIATDTGGNVYVADYYNGEIRKFSSSGVLLSKFGDYGAGHGQHLFYPRGIATDAGGNVYVSEVLAHRVLKFAPVPGQPKVDKGPPAKTRKRKATMVFHFGSKTRGAHFECRLTGQRVAKTLKRWRKCKSPKRYSRLKPGKKLFQVRAVLDKRPGEPDTRRWRVLP